MDLQISYAVFVRFHSCSHARLSDGNTTVPSDTIHSLTPTSPGGRRCGNPLLILTCYVVVRISTGSLHFSYLLLRACFLAHVGTSGTGRKTTYTCIHTHSNILARSHTYTICSVYRLFRAGIAAVEKTKLIVLLLQ